MLSHLSEQLESWFWGLNISEFCGKIEFHALGGKNCTLQVLRRFQRGEKYSDLVLWVDFDNTPYKVTATPKNHNGSRFTTNTLIRLLKEHVKSNLHANFQGSSSNSIATRAKLLTKRAKIFHFFGQNSFYKPDSQSGLNEHIVQHDRLHILTNFQGSRLNTYDLTVLSRIQIGRREYGRSLADFLSF